ncbi:hypothetical protein ACFW04_013676 [Cataglyphis niger]
MDKKDYLEKMEYILNDQSTYKKLNKDPTRQFACKINLLIKSWRDMIHKTGFPLCIIISSLSSPLYNISKYIHDILLNSNLQPRSHVKDGWSFAFCVLSKNNWNDIAPNTKFNLSQFLYAVKIILDSTSFSFNGKFYEQIFDSPMGSPLLPILAHIVMDDLKTHCLGLLSFAVSMYCRYVDDIFAIVPRAKIDMINVIFNSYHQRLKFTHEIESDSCINFSNTSVIRSNGKIVTNWYRKPTFLNRLTIPKLPVSFQKAQQNPFKYKINIIFNLIDHQILLNNCFPTHVINRYIYKRLNFLKHRVNSIPDKCLYNQTGNLLFNYHITTLQLSFVEGLSDDIGRMFKNMGFTVVYNIPKKLNSLIKRGKDRLPISNRTKVVYKINCKNCSALYIGQTKRHLSTRVKEHFNNIKMQASNLSLISKHKLKFNHDFDWSTPDILHNEKHLRKREIAKMFFY